MNRQDRSLLLVYALGVVLLHTIPTGSVPLGESGGAGMKTNHLLHLAMFLPWGFLTLSQIQWQTAGAVRRVAGWIALGLFLAVCAEGIQHELPYRTFKLTDLFMNFAGVLVGSAVAAVIKRPPLSASDPRKR